MKKHLSKRLVALVLALVLCLSLVAPAGAYEESSGTNVKFEQVSNDLVSSSLRDERRVESKADEPLYKATDNVRVSIVLEDVPAIYAASNVMAFAEDEAAVAYREVLAETQDAVAAEISAETGEELDVVWNLTLAANIISANVQYGDIETIEAVPGVSEVLIENRYEPDVASVGTADPNMATSSEQIGSGLAWAAGYTGAGSKVAVIDTGTDTDHKSFNAEAFVYAIEQTGKDVDLMDAGDIAAVLTQLNAYDGESEAEAYYLNAKLPFAYNYVDEDFDVTHDNDTQGEHGSHVAGIATANRYIKNEDGTFSDALTSVYAQGVAPDAQLITMKVFGKGGGAYDSDYMAAIEDAVVLGCDSINLSLGSGNPGFSNQTNTEYQKILDNLANAGAVVSISAGNSGTWQENTTYGYLYNTDVSMQTDGSPGSYTNAFTVASIDNTGNTGNFLNFGGDNTAVAFTETSGYTNAPIATLDKSEDASGTVYDFILFDDIGVDNNYASLCEGKVVMVKRGTTSFYEKHEAVGEVGGIACIVMNNQAGTINMDLSDSTATIPCVSITQADAESIKTAATPVKDTDGNTLYYTGKVTISSAIKAVQGDLGGYMTMSSFSSWGIPGSLELKPEITAPGGNIYSVNGAVAGGEAYENMSGTSMAAPQVAGMAAVLAQYLREEGYSWAEQRAMSQSLLMSTATPVMEEASGSYYSLLNQGAGLANVNDAINANSYIVMDPDANAGAADGKVKVELGDDPKKTGVYSFTYTLVNLTDEDKYYEFDTDVFTQDVFAANTYSGVEVLLDTWTTALDATVTYEVTGGSDVFNGGSEGALTDADAQRVLDALSGKGEALTDAEKTKYDVDGDDSVTTYDAHLILNMYDMEGEQGVKLPANGEVTVTVTIDVTGCDFTYYPNGAYIEAFSYAKEFSTEEGVEGTTHSIPVLGFYGNWSDPSMYDVGTLVESYVYGTEDRYPYLANYTYDEEMDGFITNFLTVKYPGDNSEYYFTGNPIATDDGYDAEKNAFNSNGSLYKYYVSIIRNAGASKLLVKNVETGEVYYDEQLGSKNSAYYYSNGSAWYNTQASVTLDWQGTDAEGNKLKEGTQVDVSLVLAPEYYVTEDGTDWDALGEGAYMTTRVAIDNTAPELVSLTYSEETGKFTATAKDNRYLAAVVLYQDGWGSSSHGVPAADVKEGAESTFELSYIKAKSHNFYLQVIDYANNVSTYKFTLDDNGLNDDLVNPTSITLPEAATVVKGTSIQLTPEFEPWLAKTEVTWSSDDKDVATVDENGLVTGVEVGTTTITATSAYNETVYATCEVTVKAYEVTLNGILQDVNGDPQLFTWDLETDKTWSETADVDNNLNAATYGNDLKLSEDGNNIEYNDDVMYQMDTSGYLYKVDLTSGETLEKSTATVAFGAPVDDMEYAYISSQLFGENILFGVYGGYLLYSVPAEDNTFSYGWDLASYLAYYTGSSALTTISWVGYTTSKAGNYVDVFYCLDDAGYIWLLAPDLQTGDASLNFFATDLDLSFPGYDGTYYCSMVMGDDGNLYLSYFDGSTNQIYVLEENEDGDYNATLLGDIGDGVWPCALLTVSENKDEDETPTEGDAIEVTTRFELEATEITFPAAQQGNGGLNAVSLERGTGAKLDKLAVGNNATISVDVAAEASTNGLLKLAYDADVLTFETLTSNNKDVLYSYVDNKDGLLTLAYAAKDAQDGDIFTLTFSYNENSCPFFTDVDVTTEEENTNFEATEVSYRYRLRLTPGAAGNESGTPVTPTEPTEPTEPEWPFADIPTTHPFYEDIKYVYENGLMNGTSATLFESDLATTRGMIATILYRMEGSPAVTGACSFTDVLSGQYYTDAVIWAAANGIVTGYDEKTFGPNDLITREQMAAILYRYAQNKGVDVSVGEDTNILSYNDFASISEYAIPAFQWVCGAGIINGTSATTLSPTANATRGQVAAILHRYCAQLG